MLEGLIQAYLDGSPRGWTPRDDAPPRSRDSPRAPTPLTSPQPPPGHPTYANKLARRHPPAPRPPPPPARRS